MYWNNWYYFPLVIVFIWLFWIFFWLFLFLSCSSCCVPNDHEESRQPRIHETYYWFAPIPKTWVQNKEMQTDHEQEESGTSAQTIAAAQPEPPEPPPDDHEPTPKDKPPH